MLIMLIYVCFKVGRGLAISPQRKKDSNTVQCNYKWLSLNSCLCFWHLFLKNTVGIITTLVLRNNGFKLVFNVPSSGFHGI